jgi:transcriptional regulator with XRE-family HTH domain
MNMEDWSDYVRRIVGDLNQLEIAAKTGLAQTNIGRWLRGIPQAPKVESVVQFARAFGQPPVEALVAAGYITAEEAGAKARRQRTPLSEYSEEELVDDLRRRVLQRKV